MTDTPNSAAEWDAHAYERRVAEVAGSLRRLADQVEREGTRRSAADPFPVHDVIHALMWGLANLGLDNLVRVAGEANRHVVREPGDD